MDKIKEFMERVVPWPAPGSTAVINMHWNRPNNPGWGGKPFNRVEDFVTMIPWCVTHPGFIKDVYFCLSQQALTGPLVNNKATVLRNTSNATFLKALWLDLDGNKTDPKKGYSSKAVALAALGNFLKAANMPFPSAVVDSGGGYHVYWISDVPLTVDEWALYAAGLWALVKKHGLVCDPITQDVVRILRVPGTFNYKTAPYPKVKLLHLGEDYAFKSTLSHLLSVQGVVNPIIVAQTKQLPPSNVRNPHFDWSKGPAQAFINLDPKEGVTERDHTPLQWPPVAAGCPFFRDTITTGGKDNNEPLWHLVLLAASFCENAEPLAHKLSNGYPTYDPTETDEKFAQKVAQRDARGLGWPACEAFERAGASQCATCTYKGKIRSPLNLTSPVQPATFFLGQSPEVGVSGPPPSVGSAHSAPLAADELPPGYIRDTKTGFVSFEYDKPIGGGQTTRQTSPLFLCKTERFWAEKGHGGPSIHFLASTDLGSPLKPITVPAKIIGNTQALVAELFTAGAVIEPTNKERLGTFMAHFMAKLYAAKEATEYVPYGWYTNDKGELKGFAFAGNIYKDDKTVVECGMGDETLRAKYTPTGTVEPWFKALNLIVSQNRPWLEALTACSFGAPLMVATGHYNGTVTANGGSGGNKTSAIMTGLAVWGHPKRTKQVPKASEKGLLKTLAEIRNLLVCWDDIKDQEVKKVLTIVNDVTHGMEAVTLFQNRNIRPQGEWQSMLLVAANVSLADKIVQANKNDSATLNRVFEINIDVIPKGTPGRMPSYEADRIFFRGLEKNYGLVGMEYAKMLGEDPLFAITLVEKIQEQIAKRVQQEETERFWLAIASVIVAGAILGNECLKRIKPDAPQFNVQAIMDYVCEAYMDMRKRLNAAQMIGGSQSHTEKALTIWLKNHGGETIWSWDVPMGHGRPKNPTRTIGPMVGSNPKIDAKIRMQWVVDKRLLRISLGDFQKFMDEEGFSGVTVVKGLKDHYGATTPKNSANMCAGASSYQSGLERLIVIPVPPGSPFEDTMYAHTPYDQRPVDDPTHSDQSEDDPTPSDSASEQPLETPNQ